MTQIRDTNNFAMLMDEISRYSPSEIVVNELMFNSTEEIIKIKERFETYISKSNGFSQNVNEIKERSRIVNEDDKEIEKLDEYILAITAANGLIAYLVDTQKNNLEYLNKIFCKLFFLCCLLSMQLIHLQQLLLKYIHPIFLFLCHPH